MKRRDILAGVVAAGAAVAAGVYRFTDLVVKHYAPTPYDDLLHQIVDRRPAAALGKVLPRPDVAALAAQLRQPGFALGRRARTDAAAGRVVEAHGWIVPESVAAYSRLAAQF